MGFCAGGVSLSGDDRENPARNDPRTHGHARPAKALPVRTTRPAKHRSLPSASLTAIGSGRSAAPLPSPRPRSDKPPIPLQPSPAPQPPPKARRRSRPRHKRASQPAASRYGTPVPLCPRRLHQPGRSGSSCPKAPISTCPTFSTLEKNSRSPLPLVFRMITTAPVYVRSPTPSRKGTDSARGDRVRGVSSNGRQAEMGCRTMRNRTRCATRGGTRRMFSRTRARPNLGTTEADMEQWWPGVALRRRKSDTDRAARDAREPLKRLLSIIAAGFRHNCR